MTDRINVPCPHPRCDGVIPVARDLPSGSDYKCLCKVARLRLAWDDYLDRGRVPRLTLEGDKS